MTSSLSPISYPNQIEIIPLASPPRATIKVPGSKSITNRALILAACADPSGDCLLTHALWCEDTVVMVNALSKLGFEVDANWHQETIRVRRPPSTGIIPAHNAELDLANSGTSIRFLTAFVALGEGRYRLDGTDRMRERPIEDLLSALRLLGSSVASVRGNGCPPVVVDASGLSGGRITVKGDTSSQYLSGLLLAAPFARDSIHIEVEAGLVSEPYVDMTLAMMLQFGARVTKVHSSYHVEPNRAFYPPQSYPIEPDASSASYFLAAAAITGGEVCVEGLTEDSLQGDAHFSKVLQSMGCRLTWTSDGCTIRGEVLHGIDVDMNGMSDCVMTLAAVACHAKGPTRIRNVAHIRHKESDRIHAVATELSRAGIVVETHDDGLSIWPGPLRATTFATYNDHRMAMSLSLLGLKSSGMVIDRPQCVSKTYPRFFSDLELLRGDV